jgi:hypothetical protein
MFVLKGIPEQSAQSEYMFVLYRGEEPSASAAYTHTLLLLHYHYRILVLPRIVGNVYLPW